MQIIKDCLEIITICCLIYYLYTKIRRPKLKTVEEKVKKPKKKRHYKYLRRIRIPYVGKTKILQFDLKHGYIESVWNEIQKPRKK